MGSLRKASLALLLVAAATGAPAAQVSCYREEVRLAEGGAARVRLTLDVTGTPGEVVTVPFGHAGVTEAGLEVTGATGARITCLDGGPRVLAFTLAAVSPGPVTVRFDAPAFLDWKKVKAFGNRFFSYGLVNATPARLGRYEGTFLLPPGQVVGAVVETVPAESESGPRRPYEIVRVDGLDGVRLTDDGAAPGDTVHATFRFKPPRRPSLFLLALVGLAGLYLIRFSDLVRRDT